MEFENGTPFTMQPFVHLDASGAEQLTVVLTATYDIAPDGALSLTDPQPPVVVADAFAGDAGASSMTCACELTPEKPGTDVLLTGSAIARRPRTRAMDVRLCVGTIEKVVRVFGTRRWKRRLGRASIEGPEPFDEVPLVYELAFGGVDDSPKDEKRHAAEPHNPIGRGFRAERSQLEWNGTELPQIEDPSDLITSPTQRVAPAGFGPICRHWLPRLAHAGTYDDAWVSGRLPLLPVDFDARFHQAAPEDLIATARLSGGEPVEITGCTREGVLTTALPTRAPAIEIRVAERSETPPVALDTVHIDTRARTLRIVWKGTGRVHGELPRLRRIACTPGARMPAGVR